MLRHTLNQVSDSFVDGGSTRRVARDDESFPSINADLEIGIPAGLAPACERSFSPPIEAIP
jgi:hypothetical protein